MWTIKVIFPNATPLVNSQIPERQVFYADSVGNGSSGVYVKLDGCLYPIKNGQVAAKGQDYSSHCCPVSGYQPIQFQLCK